MHPLLLEIGSYFTIEVKRCLDFGQGIPQEMLLLVWLSQKEIIWVYRVIQQKV